MRHGKLFGWTLALVVALGAVFTMLYGPSHRERETARDRYEEARAELDSVTARRRALDQRVDELRTRVDSVELSARIEYRLARPGERIELVRETSGGDFLP